jgi:hypothetical protein
MSLLESEIAQHLAGGQLLYAVTRLGRIRAYTPREYTKMRSAFDMMGWTVHLSMRSASAKAAAVSAARLAQQ